MGIFSFFNRQQHNKEEGMPWTDRPAILAHIASNLDADGKLTEDGSELPDEERFYEGNKQLRWVAGGLDGVLGHHGGGGEIEQKAQQIANLVKTISQANSPARQLELYKLLLKDEVLGFVDPALEQITKLDVAIEPYLHTYARWLAFTSPDRGPVKFGIALLGVIGDQQDLPNITTLGKQEEFTLFAATALTNMHADPDAELWKLAKAVDGWGRIHLVERLSETQDPDIRRWLVREGYKNSIMYEYLAYTCAVAGDLRGELDKPAIDDQLLAAAGDIISALLAEGPAEDIDVYDEGAEVARLYVGHIESRPHHKLEEFLVLHAIKDFLESKDADWQPREEKGWTTDLRSNLLIELYRLLADPIWQAIVLRNQTSDNEQIIWQVDQAAGRLGLDVWEMHWQRLVQQPEASHRWFFIMKYANNDRIDQIVSLATNHLDLAGIATGPANELGVGPGFTQHGCLDFVLQDINRYPGKGGNLIKAGLRSPVTRNRNFAVKALSGWDQSSWPAEMKEFLEKAMREEPDAEIRKKISELLKGAPIS